MLLFLRFRFTKDNQLLSIKAVEMYATATANERTDEIESEHKNIKHLLGWKQNH